MRSVMRELTAVSVTAMPAVSRGLAPMGPRRNPPPNTMRSMLGCPPAAQSAPPDSVTPRSDRSGRYTIC